MLEKALESFWIRLGFSSSASGATSGAASASASATGSASAASAASSAAGASAAEASEAAFLRGERIEATFPRYDSFFSGTIEVAANLGLELVDRGVDGPLGHLGPRREVALHLVEERGGLRLGLWRLLGRRLLGRRLLLRRLVAALRRCLGLDGGLLGGRLGLHATREGLDVVGRLLEDVLVLGRLDCVGRLGRCVGRHLLDGSASPFAVAVEVAADLGLELVDGGVDRPLGHLGHLGRRSGRRVVRGLGDRLVFRSGGANTHGFGVSESRL